MPLSSTPSPTDWPAIKALYEAAQAQPEAQREGWVQASGATAAVQAEVLSLLAQDAAGLTGSQGFLARPAAVVVGLDGLAALDAVPEPLLAPGLRLGPWEVVGPLGSGGMAEVLLARRADGAWEGEAAIKVLKRGMDSSAVLARFALEQRALARLNHPHIARLLDAGRSPAGQPYFVMEKIDGLPMDAACEGRSLAERLALFLQLADAVAFAHRQLLVHRDLKPSNVLVTPEGQVKLLDFGIAKALDPLETLNPDGDATGAATLTHAGQRPFTPLYASPEQVRGDPVSTATDLYSLGVLLYLMLTGQRPYGRQASTPQQAMRSVLEDEPTRPSALSPAVVPDPDWPATRRRLKGDLDNILLKALEKSPERRYPSVEAMARDVRAHLANEPVSAHAPLWRYRAGKFIARNRAASLASALAVLALVAGAGVALWQARLAQAERDVAQQRFAQVRQLAKQLVFKYHDQIEMLPGATQARSALLQDAAEFLDGLHQAAETDPGLARELAETYYRISRLQGVDRSINTGQHSQAERNLDKALALSALYMHLPDTPVPAVTDGLSMLVSKAELWQRRGQVRQAEQALQQALPIQQALLKRAPNDAWALTSAINLHGVRARLLGSLEMASLGDWRQACTSADLAQAAAQANAVADPLNRYAPDSLAFAVGEQAQCRMLAAQWAQAERLFSQQRELRDAMAQLFPDDMDFRYQRAVARANLSRAMAEQGRLGAARQLLDEAQQQVRQAMQMDPGNQAGQLRLNTMRRYSVALHLAAGQTQAAQQEAQALLRDAPAAAASASAVFDDLRQRVDALLWAARAWRVTRPAQALAWATEASQGLQTLAGNEDNLSHRWLLAQTVGEQAHCHAQLGQTQLAAERAAQAMALWQSPSPHGPPPNLQPRIQALRPLLKG